jgi:enoyl-CoA hydratase
MRMAQQAPLLIEHGPGHAVITLNRPDKLNALNSAVLAALDDALDDLTADPAVRGVIVTGAGSRAFCAGADLAELHGIGSAEAAELLANGQRIIGRLGKLGVPVIAAVNGYALGGGFEIALAATFTLASVTASFGLPETSLGLIPGYGGTQRLARLVGRQRAAYIISTGKRITAAEAHGYGLLAEEPLESAELLPRAIALVSAIAERGRYATAAALAAIAASESGLEVGLRLETQSAAVSTASTEAQERVTAFLSRSTGPGKAGQGKSA